jgi:hypothetical protein
MRPLFQNRVDSGARRHVAGVIASILGRTLEWQDVPAALGPYAGPDKGVAIIHAELRSLAAESAVAPLDDPQDDEQLHAVLRRSERFLRSDLPYRWHEKGPVQIMGAYMGAAALAWFIVAGLGALLGWGHEAVVAAALFAFVLMYAMAIAMAVALFRRLWWKIVAQRERADRRVWPFFTSAEHLAASDDPEQPDSAEQRPW